MFNNLSASIEDCDLDNGLMALFIEFHKAPLTTLQIWCRVDAKEIGLQMRRNRRGYFKGRKEISKPDNYLLVFLVTINS